nr:2-phosphosulfolactate phosphatase [Rubrobacter sp.]
VAGKDVIFVTTNGTRAIAAADSADEVLLGCLRNAPAVARYLEESGSESVYVICAGSKGRFNVEDFLGAASILSRMDVSDWYLNDAARLALEFADLHKGNTRRVLEGGRVGRWFVENKPVETLDFFADVGASELVPKVVDGRLRRTDQAQAPASPDLDA